MNKRPRFVYILILSWLILSFIFIVWGYLSLVLVLGIPGWEPEIPALYPLLYFANLLSTITWLVFALLFFSFSFGAFKGYGWAWTAGIITYTIFIVIFGLMLTSFMVTAILFPGFFSIAGLESVIVAFLIDLGIVYCLTRLTVKTYFKKGENDSIII
jgi:hypothetical protein